VTTGFVLLMGILVLGTTRAEAEEYNVTITNLTRGQVITPPLLFTHEQSFKVFKPGQKARVALRVLAETGNPNPLKEVVEARLNVLDVQAGPGVIPPGQSVSLTVKAYGLFHYLTAVGMLAQTNDGFFAIQGIEIPHYGTMVVWANAYDAGSEANNEMAPYVPGPPFGGDMRETNGAEGFIHIHPGIHGIGDLSAAEYDWRNPVAKIVITKMN
jgi:hypothetical protein